MFQRLAKLSVQLCDADRGKSAVFVNLQQFCVALATCLLRPSLESTIPALIDHGVMSSVDEVRTFSMSVLLDIVKHSGVFIRLPALS